ncbi:YdcH family protein [Atlantibacter hermannii]|uniref:YdcH family protein n=1 Tax=Atlantibacter hermannii TaxID=565 RepID=UPI0028AF16B3|nr:YdcH family protein [Atlantibacter hermannii]MCQ4966238.1 YdcH family protein [Enterobacteriaceae bacterium DFI.7.85]
MFPEYNDLIPRLKAEHPRFESLLAKHNALNQEISRREGANGRGYCEEVARLKKEKLHLKDKIFRILQQESLQSSH